MDIGLLKGSLYYSLNFSVCLKFYKIKSHKNKNKKCFLIYFKSGSSCIRYAYKATNWAEPVPSES